MSKTSRTIFFILAAAIQILHLFNNSQAQDIQATLKVEGSSVSVSGKNTDKRKNLSFLLSFAGVDNLGDRVSGVNLFDADGKAVTFKKFMAGEYVADADFAAWSYKIDLTPLKKQTAAAHVSWLAAKNGILMLDDMLPQFAPSGKKVPARVRVEMPENWKAFSARRIPNTNEFEYLDVEKAVIFVGEGIRDSPVSGTGTTMRLVFEDPPDFDPNEAADLATRIFEEYRTQLDAEIVGEVYIALLKFPERNALGQWEAETRGTTITLLSDGVPFKSQFAQRLHEQLRHEMFHLWIPNRLNLSGNYDWFYEGFALYQSLKLGVGSNRIRFDDYLDTLSRAYNIDSAPSQRVSLIEASKQRWNGGNTQIYARGMLVAFLCDLALMEGSKGKRSTVELVREIYLKYHSAETRKDGNDAIAEAFRTHVELRPIVDRYITGSERIDWQTLLSGAGIEAVTERSQVSLKVTAKPEGRQKDLLDKLGYNNWRKLTEKNR